MPPHALIIDDNQSNADVLVMLLDSQGVSATAISSPRYLANALSQIERVDVVFLDIEIPNYDGFAIFQDLAADPRLENVPIVAYTVHTSEVDEARKAGFHGFLGKPLQAQRFPEQLRLILNGQPIWEP